MPEITIPLVGAYNQRQHVGISSQTTGAIKDQRFINCVINVSDNKLAQSRNLYLEKRPGMFSLGTVNSGQINTNVYKATGGSQRILVANGASNSNIRYLDSTLATNVNCGTITGLAEKISEGYLGAELFYFFVSTDQTGWFLADGAANDSSPTFTADTNTNTTLSNVSSTTNVYVGQALSGSGIQNGTRVASISGSTITLTIATTATAVGVTVTFERIAKIIDADFPTSIVGEFVVIDGYVLIAEDTNRRIYNSALNNPASWAASDYLTFGVNSDIPASLFKYKGQVGCWGVSSTEFYFNAGNAVGSPFSRSDSLTTLVGANGDNARAGDRVFWIGGEGGQNRAIYTFNGFSPEKVSSAGLDRAITGYFGFDVSAFNMSGMTYVYLGQTAAPRRKFLICLDTGAETEMETTASVELIFAGGRSDQILANQDNQGIYIVDNETDELFQFRDDIFQDDSSAFTLTAQTSKVDLGTGNRKTYITVWLMGSDVQTSGTATLEYSDDDYATWVTAGTFDLTEPQPKISRAGSHEGGRAWRLTHSANTAFRAQALKFDYTVGRH